MEEPGFYCDLIINPGYLLRYRLIFLIFNKPRFIEVNSLAALTMQPGMLQ